MKLVNVSDVCNEVFAGGDVPKDNWVKEPTSTHNIPIYSNGEANDGLYGYTDYFRVKEPSVTVSARGTIGYTVVRMEPFVPVVRLITLVPKTEVIDLKYLCYAIQNYKFDGTGTSIPQLTVPMLKQYTFKLVDLAEQKRIVQVIDKIADLIKNRKQQLQKLDELVKARFVEMFGNPILNEKNNRISPLNEVCIKITDGTHDTPVRCPDGYLLVTGKNIREKGIIFDEVEYVSEEDHRLIYNRCNPEYGDVLYTNIGVNYGTACFNNLHYEFSMKNVALLKPNKEIINGYYLWECLNLMRSHLLEMNQVGGAQTFMSLSTIKKITIPVSDIKLQAEFADFVEEIDKSKLNVQKSLNKLETLKKALMQKYFG